MALTFVSCGSDTRDHVVTVPASVAAAGPAPADSLVVKVGKTPISGATYNHWMAIGDATVEIPVPGRPPPKPIPYEPPTFTACIVHLEASVPKPPGTTAQLKVKCRHTYTGIQARILNFLITGYWLRSEAGERRVSVTAPEVRKKFEEEKRANYPTASSFRSLQEASRQTVPDLMFAVETQMLSAKLFQRFVKTQRNPQGVTVSTFNHYLQKKWIPLTSCQPGYVVKDCAQYNSTAAP